MIRVRIMNKVWQLRFVSSLKNRGDCDSPDVKNKQIRIRSSLHGEEKLEVLLHEMLHAADWHRSEEWVSKVSKDIARTLCRIGYMEVDDG